MADPPFVLLLVAADEADRRRIGGLLDDAARTSTGSTSVASALAAVGEHPHDAVLIDAPLAGDGDAPRAARGGPAGAGDRARRPERRRGRHAAARAAGAVDHLPKAGARRRHAASAPSATPPTTAARSSGSSTARCTTRSPGSRTARCSSTGSSSRCAARAGAGRRSGAAVLFLDLDRFKVVNDSLGHQVGDQLLQAVALRLDAALRPGDTVARMGGDEFTVLLEDVTDAREATVVAERVLATLADPFDVAGRELFVSSSIGIALGGPDADPEELIRDADVAMYRAKAQGKARHAVFDAQMHRHVLARLDLETDLRRAIEAGSLQVLFQPILRADDRRAHRASRRCAAGRSTPPTSSRSPRRPG